MGKFPDYACSCCGYTNGDMFYDRDVEITEQDKMEFEAYRKMWHLMKEELAKEKTKLRDNVWPRSRIGKPQSQETRDKISATIRAKRTEHAHTKLPQSGKEKE